MNSNNNKIGKSKKMSGNKLTIVLEQQPAMSISKHVIVQKGMHVVDQTFQYPSHSQQCVRSNNACMSSVSSGSPKSSSSASNLSANVWQHVSNRNLPTVGSSNNTTPTITKWRCTSSTFANYIVETNSFNSVEKKRVISEKEILGVLHLSQQKACKQLNCSLSTLKRRFYELKDGFGLERWPQYFFEIRHLPIFKKIYPMNLQFILNSDEE
ncbi:predicted protein [Naegleria gruberi]|uniref:Predicted protein n=1 Tax=Naegleria gruberi TaxID=5762 RepID=D2VS15_NAEGR|nr:uncharacterized protein NAEGRDRAFT_71777 [Naegleria gruberi]EFC40340.1 predicted protein [Naegleria gruberi]|eukprot:XP_002673084.1 predicted protein [Naegleria gruberi strain NEG-M]